MAGMYAVYHGPENLKEIALKIHSLTSALAEELKRGGYEVKGDFHFDTLKISVPDDVSDKIRKRAEEKNFNFFYCKDSAICISLDELTTREEVNQILEIFEAGSIQSLKTTLKIL